MLSQRELKQLASLLAKIKNPGRGLPQPVFDALLKIVPFVCCELVIVKNGDPNIRIHPNDPNSRMGALGLSKTIGQRRLVGILLTWRDDKWFKGWHFPGGIMRYRESFEERIQKTAQSELGVKISNYRFLFPINYNRNRRGHGVSLVFLCRTKMKPKDGKFFSKMPKDIIEEHREVWKRINSDPNIRIHPNDLNS